MAEFGAGDHVAGADDLAEARKIAHENGVSPAALQSMVGLYAKHLGDKVTGINAQLTAAKSTVAAAQSAVLAAQEQLAASQTQTEGTSIEQHPNVARAAARVREAYLAVQRAQLVAPLDGHIA